MTLSSFVLLAAVGRVSKANSLGFFLLARGKDVHMKRYRIFWVVL